MTWTLMRKSLTWLLILAAPAGAEWAHLGAVSSITQDETQVRVDCGTAAVRLDAMTRHVLRVQLVPDGDTAVEQSWAVTNTKPLGAFRVADGPNGRAFQLEGLEVVVGADPCQMTISDPTGRVLLAEPAMGVRWWRGPHPDGIRPFRASFKMDPEAGIYGLGEKSGPVDRGGRAWSMWNTDAYAYGSATDPLYVSVPFFLIESEGVFVGILLDNTWRTTFDFGVETRGQLSFGADGGALNYYVIAGPSVKDVLARYTALTGHMELPPRWATGYHQCRFSYYPEARMRDVAATFRNKRIPCDVLWFDIDYMEGYRCFTWDPNHFPDPRRLNAELHAKGFHTVAIIDPGIKQDPGYFVYDEGTVRGAWLREGNGSGSPYVGRVWPGACVFPDFTNPKVRDWWAGLFPAFLQNSGLDGIWNDMNEPANFADPSGTLPRGVETTPDGMGVTHAGFHNIYGMQMARTAVEGMRRAYPERRAFTLTRANFAGGQRYAAVWTGDNVSSWEHLRMSIPMVLGMGLSGMPFTGPDIGGFTPGADPLLFARWIQFGALYPFCRTHSSNTTPDQEPWAFGERVEQIARKAISRRYELLPYLYTCFEEASRTGVPVWRPIWMEFPGFHTWANDATFMLGGDIFVAPLLDPSEDDHDVRLPPGVWYDARTDLRHGGQRWFKVPGRLEDLPMFVRGGAIIPMQSVVQHTGQVAEEPLILDVWPYGDSEASLYEDDGTSYAYREGAFRRTRFTCSLENGRMELTIHAPEGSYAPAPRSPLLRLHGLPRAIERVSCAAQNVAVTRDQPSASTRVISAGDFARLPDRNVWLVRMHPDQGTRQSVLVHLESSTLDAAPVIFEFDDPAERMLGFSRTARPEYRNGLVRFAVRSTESPVITLPRMRVPAEMLTRMHLRMASGKARKLSIRFATEESPDDLRGEDVTFTLISDGQLRDYVFDMADRYATAWEGTVYRVELVFLDGVASGETIEIERVAFEPGG